MDLTKELLMHLMVALAATARFEGSEYMYPKLINVHRGIGSLVPTFRTKWTITNWLHTHTVKFLEAQRSGYDRHPTPKPTKERGKERA